MRVAGLVHDSIVDGPGLRFVCFVQGCLHHCPGCHNPESHDPTGGEEMAVEEIAVQMLSNPLTDGLTISGGEPFDQAWECLALASRARRVGLNVWCYTGYTFESLLEYGSSAQKAMLRYLDVLVDGPYIEAERTLSLPWRGSKNQRLIDVQASLKAGKVIEWQAERRADNG
jgi:anaerobic ribonucleoside-triphosphate reductase activating protein